MTRRACAAALMSAPIAMVAGCDDPPKPKPPAPDVALAPSTPVDIAFEGCAQGCGVQFDYDPKTVVVQPPAAAGDLAHCPVSGAVFAVRPKSPRRLFDKGELFFCCEACAEYFSKNADHVLAVRGIAPGGKS